MNWQTCTLSDVMGDDVIYRNLEPIRQDIPGLRAAWAEVGLERYYVPRKTDPEYALALMHTLKQAQQIRGIQAPLERALFIGDTLMLDGSAAHNVGKHLPMLGFIGAERSREPAKIEIQGDLMVANRWGALADYLRWLDEMRFAYDERTVLLIDLDKTSLGARGRNDKLVDEARVQAIYRTMRNTLGPGFDEVGFRQVYDALNVPKYHAFTADNQDYLAYVCLMVIGGVCPAEEMWRDLGSGALSSIQQFVGRCHTRQSGMATGLLAAHQEVHHGIEIGDPTPFKAFRRVEYLETVGRMNVLPQGAAEESVLGQEIVITAEVMGIAGYMAKRGVLVFGISDKPDEASLPTAEQSAQGFRALHRTPMKVYGNPLF